MLLPLLLGAALPDDAPDEEPEEERAVEAPPVEKVPPAPHEDVAPEPDEPDRSTPDYDPYTPDVGPVSRDHPAYDRVQDRDAEPASSSFLFRATGIFLLVVVALAVTYLLLRPEPTDGTVPDLLALTAAHAGTVELELVTDDLDVAQEYIITEFGWPVRVPVLPDARLVGVGIDEIAEGVELPVLQYTPEEGAPITVFMYDYAFLDAASGRLRLAPAVYSRLAEDQAVDVRRVGDTSLVLWRRRAAIYTAVTDGDPAPLVDYLRRRPQ